MFLSVLLMPTKKFFWDLNSLHSDANKTVFDWCKDGNVKKMDLLLTRGENINVTDEQVVKVPGQSNF